MNQLNEEVMVELKPERSEEDKLAEAYETIAKLTEMLDRALAVIDRISQGEISVKRDELLQAQEEAFEAPCSPYVGVSDVMEMFGCSQQSAYKHLRAAGAASIGRKLIAKRSAMVESADGKGLRHV